MRCHFNQPGPINQEGLYGYAMVQMFEILACIRKQWCLTAFWAPPLMTISEKFRTARIIDSMCGVWQWHWLYLLQEPHLGCNFRYGPSKLMMATPRLKAMMTVTLPYIWQLTFGTSCQFPDLLLSLDSWFGSLGWHCDWKRCNLQVFKLGIWIWTLSRSCLRRMESTWT